MEAYLTSPGATTSRLMTRNGADSIDNIHWTFVSNAFWGEDPVGTWELRVIDTCKGFDDGTWNDYAVTANMGTLDLPSEWKLAAGDSYNDSANWTDLSVPNAVDAEANFLEKIEENSEVTVDSAVTVGTINFDNADYSYEIAGAATVTLETSAGDAEINVVEGDHTISAPLSSAGDVTVDTAQGTDLTIDTQTGYSVLQGALTKDGSGSLALGGSLIVLGAVDHNAGELEAGPGVLAVPGGDVNVGEATLTVSGNVPRKINMQGGADPYVATIRASGPAQLGNAVNGYNFEGTLDVADQVVSVHGAGGTPVVHYVTLDGGLLSGSPELHVAPETGYIYGTGEVSGTVRLGAPGDPAALEGLGEGQELELSGYVRGCWEDFGFVVYTGYAQPGFSPAFQRTGPGSIWGNTHFEIGGTTPTELLSDPIGGDTIVMGDYSQFYCFGAEEGQPPGPPTVFHKLSLKVEEGTTFEWDQLVAGEKLFLIRTGPYNVKVLGTMRHYQAGRIAYGPNFAAELEAALDLICLDMPPGLEWDTPYYGETVLSVRLIPEPGTLVLLISGGLGLLLLVWRRRRRS